MKFLLCSLSLSLLLAGSVARKTLPRKKLCDDLTLPDCANGAKADWDKDPDTPPCTDGSAPTCVDGSEPRPRFNLCPREERICPGGSSPAVPCVDGSTPRCPSGSTTSCPLHMKKCADRTEPKRQCPKGEGKPHCPWTTKNKHNPWALG